MTKPLEILDGPALAVHNLHHAIVSLAMLGGEGHARMLIALRERFLVEPVEYTGTDDSVAPDIVNHLARRAVSAVAEMVAVQCGFDVNNVPPKPLPPVTPKKYIVAVADDAVDGMVPSTLVLSTRHAFPTEGDAETYVGGLPQFRHPVIIECPKGLSFYEE